MHHSISAFRLWNFRFSKSLCSYRISFGLARALFETRYSIGLPVLFSGTVSVGAWVRTLFYSLHIQDLLPTSYQFLWRAIVQGVEWLYSLFVFWSNVLLWHRIFMKRHNYFSRIVIQEMAKYLYWLLQPPCYVFEKSSR